MIRVSVSMSKMQEKCRHLEAIILSTSDREMPVLLRRLFLLHQSSLNSGRFTSEFMTHIRTHQFVWTSRLKIPFHARKHPYRPVDSDARFVNSLSHLPCGRLEGREKVFRADCLAVFFQDF